MPRMLNSRLTYPEALAELWMGDQREGLNNLRDYYLQKVCATALETAATHYVRVAELIEHYSKEMVLRYLPVRYEDMVGRQAETVRTMLDFIGVPFDENCLHFPENRRYARTASYAQVTEPLYDRSVHRYRDYRRHLEPIIPLLTPIIERLGYAID